MELNTLQRSLEDALVISTKEIDGGVLEHKAVRRSSVPDLPIELWMEILSYLPLGCIRKVIGVNRFLFERGMDEIYEEVQVAARNGAASKTFEQLRYPSIAHRVRKLHIQPEFLPVLGSKEAKNWSQLKARKMEIQTFLETVLGALVGCSQLHELTIALHDQYLPKSFLIFLENLLKQVGSQTQILTLDMTSSCFNPIRETFFGQLPNLFSLKVRMASTSQHSEILQTCHALTELITTTKRTLRSLAFSESADFSFSHVFRKLHHFPLLNTLEVQASYGFNSLAPGTHLWSVVQDSGNTLQRLVIKQLPSTSPDYRDSVIRLLFVPLFSLSLPSLQDLVLDLEHKVILPKLVHLIPTFAPHLQRLSLLGRCASLTGSELQSLLNGLLSIDEKLEYLQISVIFLSPEVLQLLYASLPQLKALGVWYDKLGNFDGGEVSGEARYLFYDAFRRQEYPEWKVEGVKVMHLRSGPDNLLIKAIVESLPSLTRVVRSWEGDL